MARGEGDEGGESLTPDSIHFLHGFLFWRVLSVCIGYNVNTIFVCVLRFYLFTLS